MILSASTEDCYNFSYYLKNLEPMKIRPLLQWVAVLILHASPIAGVYGVTINSQPTDLATVQGGSVSFDVVATGTGVLAYQWEKDGEDIPGATSSSYGFVSTEHWHIGAYKVRISDNIETVSSSSGNLTINGVNVGVWKGLVAYYDFEGNIEDKTPFARHLTNTDAVAVVGRPTGSANSAFRFDGITSRLVATGYKGEGMAAERLYSIRDFPKGLFRVERTDE